MSALALDLGFSSHSHFAAAFKQAYGRSPSAFQQSALRMTARSIAKDFDSARAASNGLLCLPERRASTGDGS